MNFTCLRIIVCANFLANPHTQLHTFWNPISHCYPAHKMVAGSLLSDSQKDKTIRIVENAIQTSTQLSNASLAPAPALCNSRSENADELHCRFPTTGLRFHSRGSRLAHSHESLTVSKDVIIFEYEHDIVPTKAEKIKLEKSKQELALLCKDTWKETTLQFNRHM